MSPSRIATVVLVFAALLVPVAPANAASTVLCSGYSSCSAKGYSNFGYSSHQGTSYWRMYTGANCTNYAAYRLVTTNKMPNTRPKPGVGNAEDWGTAMASITDRTPAVGSIAWWDKGHHVAYVEKVVSSTEIIVSESHWQGAFDWRRITKSGSGWPDGFIHFADAAIKSVTRPQIPNPVAVDRPVSAEVGTWSPAADAYRYQWYVDGSAVAGATAKKYTPVAADAGRELRVRVSATRPGHQGASATSPGRTVMPGSYTLTRNPEFSGTPRVGDVLSAAPTSSVGAWSPKGNSYRYRWLADGAPVPGATARSFRPGPDQAGTRITFEVTASRPGYTTRAATSAPSAPVAPGPVTATTRPAVTGTPRVGNALAADPGTWSVPGLRFAYQWYVAGAAVTGATSATYAPTAHDLGSPVTVRVTARRAGYQDTSVTSAPTAPVATGTLGAAAVPTITGSVRVGSRLTTAPGRWPDDTTTAYQWYDSRGPIAGATARSYIPDAAHHGQRLKVRVQLDAPGYSPATIYSAATSAVARGRITVDSKPRVSGTLKHRKQVRAVIGVRASTAVTVSYQWLRNGKKMKGFTRYGHVITKADRGQLIAVRVTVRAPGYEPLVLTSPARRAAR